MSNWKLEARQYWEDGMSQRQIAKHLDIPRSTVGDYIRKLGSVPYDSAPDVAGPKILFIDIETKPILGHVWRLWDQNVGLNQIVEDWSILSFCAKWKGTEEVIYQDLEGQEDFEDDAVLLDSLWRLLNEADIVIGQNSRRFDVKKIFARFILNGLPKPSHFRQIDTMEIAKRQFGFTSNKLEYMTDKLCTVYKKQTHKQFPGHLLWAECLKGNPEAWAEMKDYNIYDVLSLEELYDILSSWDDKLPNFDVYVDGILNMDEWVKDGFHYSNFGKYQRYRNITTGVQRRSRVNELSKEKRKTLLSNIV
jgi:CENP-B N-terminal DNA-binding domain.